MNGKQAKRLRRAAVGLATTVSKTGRSITFQGYERTSADEPILVRKDSLKGIYRALKKGV
jgi:hypothetical protein